MMGQSASTDQADILGSHTTTSNTANRTSIVTDNSHTELKAQLQCDGKGMKTCLELVLSMKNGKSASVEPSTETDEQKVKPESRGEGGEPNLSQDGTPAEQQQPKQSSDPPTPTSSEKDTADMKIGKSDSNDQNKSKLSDDAKRLVFNKNANLHDAIGALIRNCITETKFSPDHAQHNSSDAKPTKEATGNVQSDKKSSMNAPSYKNHESNTVDNAWKTPGGYYQNHQPMLVGPKQGAVSEISETVSPSPKSWKGSGELARNGNQSSKPLMPKEKMHPSPESVSRTTATGGQSVVQLQAFIDKCLENTWQQQKVGMSEKLTTIGKGQFNYGSEITTGDQHQQHSTRNGHQEEVCIQSERAPAVQQMYHPNINQVAYYSEMAKQDRTSNGLDPSSMRKEINDSRYIHPFQPNNKGMLEGIRDIRQHHHPHQQPQHPQPHSQQQQQQYYTGSEMAAAAINQTYSNMMAQMHPGSAKSNPHSAGDGFESAFDAKELINKISCQARAINKFFSNSGEPAELSYHSAKMGQHPTIKVSDQQQVDYANKTRSMHSPANNPSHMINRAQENPLGSLSNHKRMMYEDGRGISYMERLNHAATGKDLHQHTMSPNYRQHKEDPSNMMSDMHHLQASVAPGQRLQGDMQQRVARLNQQQQQDMIIRSSQPGIMSKYPDSMVAHQMYGQKDHSTDRIPHYQTSPGGSMSSVTGNANNPGIVNSSSSASHAKTMERMLAAPHQQPQYMQTPGGSIIKWDDHANLNARYPQISPQSAQSVKIRGASNASMPSPQEGDVMITMAASKNHSPRTHSNSSQSGGMLTPSFMSPSSSPLIHHKDSAASGSQKLQAHYMDSLGKAIGSAPGDGALRASAAATAGGMVPQRRHTVSDMANYSSEPSKLQHASMRPLSAPDSAVISTAAAIAMPATMVGRKSRVEGENVLDLSVKRKANDGPPIAAGNVQAVVASPSAPQSASNQESPLDLSKKKPEEQFLMMGSGGSRGCEIISPGSSFHAATAAGGAGKSVPANILLKHLEYSVQKYCSNIGGSNPGTGAVSLGPNMHQSERVTPQSAAGAPQTNPLHHQQQQHNAQPHLLTAQQHHQSHGAHPPQQHYQQQHHSQTQQQQQAYQKQGLATSQMMMPHQQARNAELTLHPTSQYIPSRKDFPHGYITPDGHHRQSQQSYPIFRQPTLPALPKHGPHLQSQQPLQQQTQQQQQQQQPPQQQQQQQPPQQQQQPVVQPQAYQLSPVAAPVAATQNVSAYPQQNMEPAQNNHRSSKSANSANEKLDNNCSKKHDISKHEPVQNLLGNHAADDVLYLICKLCGQTYGSPYSFRKHFRNQHGFEPRPHHTVVQSISATISLLKGKPPEANVMVKNEDALQAKGVSNPGNVADGRINIKKIEIEDQKFDVDLCTATNSSSFKINPEDAASQNRNPLENPLSSQEETKCLECPECGKQFQLNDFGSYKKHCRSHERNKPGGGISEYAFEMSSQMWKRNLSADTEGRQCSSVPTPETISKERCPSDSGSSISVDRVLRPSSYSFDTPKSDISSQSSTAGSQNDNSNDTSKDYPLLSIHDIKQENDPYATQHNKTSELSQWSRTCIKTEAKCVDSKDGEQPPVITDDPWYPSDDSSDEHRLKIVMSELDEGSSVSVKKEENPDTDLTSDKSYSHNMDSSESFCDQSLTSEPSITNVAPGGQPSAPSASSLADSNSNSSLKKQSDVVSECDKTEVDNEDDGTFTYRHKKFQKFGNQLKRKDSNAATDSHDNAVDSKRKKATEVG